MDKSAFAAVKAALEKLTDEELDFMSLAVDFGNDPREVVGYEKVKCIFTECDGAEMSEEVKQAFGEIVHNLKFPKGATMYKVVRTMNATSATTGHVKRVIVTVKTGLTFAEAKEMRQKDKSLQIVPIKE